MNTLVFKGQTVLLNACSSGGGGGDNILFPLLSPAL